jgi:hypothetical protein
MLKQGGEIIFKIQYLFPLLLNRRFSLLRPIGEMRDAGPAFVGDFADTFGLKQAASQRNPCFQV